MKKLFASSMLALGCVACGPSLTMAGAGVQMGAADAVVNCQPVSAVDVTAGSQEKAEILFRNKAGQMNADMAVITDTTENAGQVRLQGKAYSCPKS